MNDVRTRVDEALREVRVELPDPGVAWQRGRRRRAVRTVAVAAAVLAVVGAGTSMVTGRGVPDALPPAGSPEVVDQYPQRIDDPWSTRDIEDAPPVLAGTLRTAGYDLFGVSEDGDLYELPQSADSWRGHEPVLSHDGRKLAWLAGPTTYVVRDLATGEAVEYDGLGDNRVGTTEPYMTFDQEPGFWAPDGRHLVIAGASSDAAGGPRALLLDDAGGFGVIAKPRGSMPAGWADATHPVWLAGAGDDVELVTTDLSGVVIRRVELRVPARVARWLNQWSGSVSPDGSRVLVSDDEGEYRYLLDADSGRRLRAANFTAGEASCTASWRGDRPLVHADISSSLVDGMTGEPVVAIEPTLGAGCLTLVPAALAGDPAFEPLGTTSVWPAWHAGEIALALIGLVAAALGWRRWRRRRTVPA